VRSEGGYVAVSLPGFGMVVRGGEGQRFKYACDALLDTPPSNTPPALALRPDGTLLIGSYDGLRAMGRDGCPRALEGALRSQPVYALAQDAATMFAFAGDGVWRSTDAGDSWELRSPFASGGLVTGFVLADGKLYASQGARVLVSTDEGASFTASMPERPVTLLAVDTALWAVARTAMPVGNRGYELWRADAAEGPWKSVLSLNYFGGLAVDAAGTVWVGDEGGGLLRSLDRETFTNVAPRLYPSCVHAEGERVYTCNEDLPTVPALYLANAEGQEPVFTPSQVDELVSCEGVASLCATAWVEWQRDVLLRQLLPDGGVASADASVPADVGMLVDAGIAVDAGVDADVMADASAPEPRGSDGGCSLGGASGGGWLAALLLAARRRKLQRA
jgi:outer membrane protein assembly factor BamB